MQGENTEGGRTMMRDWPRTFCLQTVTITPVDKWLLEASAGLSFVLAPPAGAGPRPARAAVEIADAEGWRAVF